MRKGMTAIEKDSSVRRHLKKLLDWEDAHAGFDKAVHGIPPKQRSIRPTGLPYSAWQILEHLRLCQRDILDFCVNPNYKELPFEEYWPKKIVPAGNDWAKSIAAFKKDRKELQSLAMDPELDLFDTIPWGKGQTYLREFLLAADHNAYHVADLIAVRRILRIWPST